MSQEDRDNHVENLIPSHWDKRPYDWAILLRNMASTIPGVKITGSGTMGDEADFSFEDENGTGFWVNVKIIRPQTGDKE